MSDIVFCCNVNLLDFFYTLLYELKTFIEIYEVVSLDVCFKGLT